jgi:hypothetical protein
MGVVFKSCLRCRKVFAKSSDSNVCDACTEVLRHDISTIEETAEQDGPATAQQIANATGLSVEKVEELIQSAGATEEPGAPVLTCEKCGERPAQSGVRYCFDCRFDLFHSLGDAAGDLEGLVRSTAYQWRRREDGGTTESSQGLAELLATKRRRTGTHRFNPAPKHGKKYG